MSNFRSVIGAIVALGVLWSTPSYSAEVLTAGSSWVNELGSVLTITNVDGNGLMTGTYVTNVGCSAGTPQQMTGFFYPGASSGGAITFSVYFQNCLSVTSWSGQYDSTDGSFQTLWYLTSASPPVWNGIAAGTDMFTPQ